MTLSPRRDFFRILAFFGGLAAVGPSTRVKAETVGNIATQDITCDNGMPAFLAFPAGGRPMSSDPPRSSCRTRSRGVPQDRLGRCGDGQAR